MYCKFEYFQQISMILIIWEASFQKKIIDGDIFIKNINLCKKNSLHHL